MEDKVNTGKEEMSLVIFEAGGERFGVDVSKVEGVIEPGEITRMPHAPDYLVGVANLRGKVIAVIDLAKKLDLNLSAEAPKASKKIVVVQTGDIKVGFLVEAPDVIKVSTDQIEPSPVKMPDESAGAFVRGIAKLETGLVVILDIDEMFGKWEKSAGEMLEEEHDEGQG